MNDYEAMYRGRQDALLRGLVGARQVYVYAPELGINVPLLTAGDHGTKDLAHAAPFFRPWIFARHVSFVRGSVALPASLLEILQKGYGEQLLSALKNSDCPRLAGLPWPHSVLRFLVADDKAAARQHIEESSRWMPIHPRQWEEAAAHWHTCFRDRAMSRQCLDRAGLHDPEAAISWQAFVGDPESALHALTREMTLGPGNDSTARARYMRIAEVWVRVFDRPEWASACLQYAQDATRSNGVVSLFRTALAWSALVDDAPRALMCACRGMKTPKEMPLEAATFWSCFGNDRTKARACLTRPSWRASRSMLARAGEYVLHGMEIGPLQTAFRAAESKGLSSAELARAARTWFLITGAAEESQRLMGRAIESAAESADYAEIAETYLDLPYLRDVQRTACREILHLAEERAANALDYVICAGAWKRSAGDDEATERCLRMADGAAEDAQDIANLAEAWGELLGRPAEVTKACSQTGRRVLNAANPRPPLPW